MFYSRKSRCKIIILSLLWQKLLFENSQTNINNKKYSVEIYNGSNIFLKEYCLTLCGLELVVNDCINKRDPWEYNIAELSGLQAEASTDWVPRMTVERSIPLRDHTFTSPSSPAASGRDSLTTFYINQECFIENNYFKVLLAIQSASKGSFCLKYQ